MDSAGSGGSGGDPGGDLGGDNPGAVLADLASVLQRLHAVPLEHLWDHETRELLAGLEVGARRLDAARVAMIGQIERSGLHQVDGHATPKVMVRHTCRLSGAEATRRERQERALRHLTLVAAAYGAGEIGTEQVDLAARVFANPRVREALVEFQPDLLVLAAECDYPVFEITLRRWERLIDTDGAEPRAERAHERRHLSLKQDPLTLAWTISGSFGALQGAQLADVLKEFQAREWEQDWTEARAEHGEEACAADVPRTEGQRAADALSAMAERAAAAPSDTADPLTEHVVVWDADTYLATVHRVTCSDPGCDAPAHGTNRWYDPATYRCETIDGHQLAPAEAALDSFHHHVRVVLIRGGQPVAMGSRRRLFTGRNRLAVRIQSPTCIWPGCWVPTSACEADHVHPHAAGGATHPANGIPLCGRHNRWKQKGYTTGRDPDSGRWRTYRPDGTEIP